MLDTDEFRSLLQRLPDGVVAVDLNLKVLFANPRAADVFAELPRPGAPLPDVAADFDVAAFAHGLFTRNARPLVVQVEVNGKTLAIHGIPAHQRRFAALVIENVSDRSRRDRSRTEFVANAAHELLTPLTGIASAAHVLESGAKEVPELRDRFLTHIARECNRLTRIARGLLVLARSQSGEEPPRPEFVTLRGLIDDALDAVAHEVDVNVRCPTEVAVFVDRDLAEVALSNVVMNAVRHSAEGAVSIDVERSGRTVAVDVSGPGLAIKETELTRLRRRFATGTGRDGGGFGLGISIASQAADAIGGRLDYFAENGATRVRVELPGGAELDEPADPSR